MLKGSDGASFVLRCGPPVPEALVTNIGQDWACIQHWYVVATCRACAG